MNRNRLFLLLLAAFVVALSSSATTNPNAQRGFAPDGLYQFNQLDHVNVFNGAPTVAIPIGQTYTSGDRLKYNLMLSYNSSIWDPTIYTTSIGDFTEMTPARTSNAGVGWLLSLGELHIDSYFIYTSPDGAQHPFKAPTLHFGAETIPGDTATLYTRDGSYLRMRDTSTASQKARAVDFPDGTTNEFVCSENCSQLSNLTRFVLTRITDPFGNSVSILRDPEPQGTLLPGTTWRWTIQEAIDGGKQTEHYITFEAWPYAPYRWVVRKVELEVSTPTFTPDNPIEARRRATYNFNYVSGGRIYRPPEHTASTQLTQVQTSELGRINVPLLESVELPDHSFWRFQYYVSVGDDIVPSFTGRPYTTARFDGLLNRFTYPTGGGVRYVWGNYGYPRRSCIPGDRTRGGAVSAGVRLRQLIDRDGHDYGRPWRYISTSNAARNTQDTTWPYDCEPATTFRNTIVDPLNNVTVNYFSIYVRGFTNPYGADANEYALPLTRQFPDPANGTDESTKRFLSTRTFQCTTSDPFDLSITPAADVRTNAAEPLNARDGSGALACTELRQRYVRYESSGDDCPPFDDETGPGCISANRRLAAERTVFVDDANSWLLVENSDFDGLGHYRTTRTSSNFYSLNAPDLPGSHPHGDVSVTTKHYNPNAQFNLTARTYSGFPLPSQSWILEIFDATAMWEERTNPNDPNEPLPVGGVARAQYVFDGRGFLTSKRVLKGDTPAPQDVVVTYNRVDAGAGRFRIEERYYGGDSGTANSLNNADYAIDRTYRFGSLERHEYKTCDGLTTVLLVELNEIDPATGLQMSTRDASGAITTFLYDELGRVVQTLPPGEVAMEYSYTIAGDGKHPATATMLRHGGGGTILVGTSTEYDPWGHVAAERHRLPPVNSDRWNRMERTFYPTGWVATETTTGPDDVTKNAGVTQYSAYDPWGRLLLMHHADDSPGRVHTTAIAYKGLRSIERTINGVAIGGSQYGSAVTTQLYDAQGRLAAVKENSAGVVSTVYEYDTSDRLVEVNDGNQVRSFSYDNTGFLRTEKHPELGTSGQIRWDEYDALGHPHQKYVGTSSGRSAFDLTFEYDAAERLRTVKQPSRNDRVLKNIAYYGANPNLPARLVGKLRQTQRYNYVPDPTNPAKDREIVITELYSYNASNHRVSQKRLTSSGVRLATDYGYDPVGNINSVTYPDLTTNCIPSSTCIAAGTERNVTFSHDLGFLTGIPGFVKSIAYHDNELASAVTHQNDVVWKQDISLSNYLRRPTNLSTTGASANWSAGPYQYDAVGSIYRIGSDSFVYDAVNRLSSATVGSVPQSFGYDRHGNITSFNGRTINVNGQTNQLSATGTQYDIAGNLKHWSDANDNGRVYDYSYDPFNMMTVESATVAGTGQVLKRAYVYDADDERVAIIDYISNKPKLRELWTVRDLGQHAIRDFEHIYDPVNPSAGGTNATARGWLWKTDSIYRGDTLTASVDASGTRHIDVDHLGTPRAVTDAGHIRVDSRSYLPFGEEINVHADPLRKKFTGHERDDDGTLGQYGDLDYMHARYYNPTYGRFLSVDPAQGDAEEPQSWNRYTYTLNNPVSRVDPDGKNWFWVNDTWIWKPGKTAIFTINGKQVKKTSPYTHLLVARAIGSTPKGGTRFQLTLYNQNKVVMTGTAFSGGGGFQRVPAGNYTLRGDIKDPSGPTAINPESPAKNPPPYYGLQVIRQDPLPDQNGQEWDVRGAYGPMRGYLNPWDPSVPNSNGNYFHGQAAQGPAAHGYTHGCLCYGTDTSIIFHLWDLGQKVPVAVDQKVQSP